MTSDKNGNHTIAYYRESVSVEEVGLALADEDRESDDRNGLISTDQSQTAGSSDTEKPGNGPTEAPDETPGFESFEEEYESAGQERSEDRYDPLEGYNRFMFQVNDTFYLYALKPVAEGWKVVGPEPVRKAVDRAFHNVRYPVRFVNSLLQLEIEGAGRETGRFVVNTTVGVGGLFDPAKHWIGWKPNEEDFGQTLAVWGVGPGFPMTLPLLGPSNLRDAAGLVPDGYLHPISYIQPFYLQIGVRGVYRVNVASLRMLGVYDRQKEEALDPYVLFRNLYHQNRKEEISR